MNVVRAKNPESVDMRGVYARTLKRLIQEDERVVSLDADLYWPIGMMRYREKLPPRMIDCGIMEANMNGVAAGLSVSGCIPFTHTFASFQSRKTLDQIFLSGGFGRLNCKYVGSDPGIMAMSNGASHMALEDMGVLMNVPSLTLLEPSDPVMLESLMRQVKDIYGLHYIRLNRKNATALYDPATEFEIGKGLVLQDGGDVTLIASGIMVEESLKAAELLKMDGISARVVDMFTWQPIDRDLILESAEKTGAIVTVENHRMATGLGSAVSYVLDEKPVPMGRIGIDRVYGEVGTLPYLMERFHLTKEDIAAKAKEVLARKQ